jgi:hypothetical protein
MMAEYPAHLYEMCWSQDGGILHQPGKMDAADLKRQRIKSA